MGTSVSHRLPTTPRWNAVRARLLADGSIDAVRAELFNAGELDGWARELASPQIGKYVEALVDAHRSFAETLAHTERPNQAVQELVESVGRSALREESASAIAVAERALARTLIETARGDGLLSESTPREASEAWTRDRGAQANVLVQRFLGEVLHQFAAHCIGREVGDLAGRANFPTSGNARLIEKQVAVDARSVAERISLDGADRGLVARWPAVVGEAFRAASRLPEQDV